jgi:hypothetical protein
MFRLTICLLRQRRHRCVIFDFYINKHGSILSVASDAIGKSHAAMIKVERLPIGQVVA